jgi:hypothetical protein
MELTPSPLLARMTRLAEHLVKRLNSRHFPAAEVTWEYGADGGLCSAKLGELTVTLDSAGELEFDGPIQAGLAAALCTHIAAVLAEPLPASLGGSGQ